MGAAEGHGEFVADFAAESARLCKAKVMGIARASAADDTWLRATEPQVPPVPPPRRLETASSECWPRSTHVSGEGSASGLDGACQPASSLSRYRRDPLCEGCSIASASPSQRELSVGRARLAQAVSSSVVVNDPSSLSERVSRALRIARRHGTGLGEVGRPLACAGAAWPTEAPFPRPDRGRLVSAPTGRSGASSIVLARDADEGEQGIAARIGEGGPKAMRGGGLADRAHRPVRGDPFARGMGEHGRQADQAARVDLGRLNGRDLVPSKALADDVEAARRAAHSESVRSGSAEWGGEGGGQRLLGIDESACALASAAAIAPIDWTSVLHGCLRVDEHRS